MAVYKYFEYCLDGEDVEILAGLDYDVQRVQCFWRPQDLEEETKIGECQTAGQGSIAQALILTTCSAVLDERD